MFWKISEARNTNDDEERNNLLERNKHICLTDKYGWDTVEKSSGSFPAGKSSNNPSRDSPQTCFCCFRTSHFMRECQVSLTSKGSEWA